MEQQQPDIFLSHAGPQKELARRLYLELHNRGYRVFFDEDAGDSLPKGRPFPPLIVKACRTCKMGIVILSHDYVGRLWPMLELEQLSFHNPNILLYPLFYQLSSIDLSKEENLTKWQARWTEKEEAWQSRVQEVSIDILSWRTALDKLKRQSGSVFYPPHMREHDYIQEIVSNICQTMPSSRKSFFLDQDHVKGTERMQQVIVDLFQQAAQKSSSSTYDLDGVLVVGVWGLGGLGKTTLCKHMVNFYGKEFPGRSCFIELPTGKNEKILVEAMKPVVLALGRAKKEHIEGISWVEEIMELLKEGLRNQKVFLAIDNVWDWAIQRAKEIMSLVCMPGSKILVTGRSRMILELAMLPRGTDNIVPIPSITVEEAVELLKNFSVALPVIPDLEEDLRSLVRRLCFFGDQCHPLLLKVMGAKLRCRGGGMKNGQDWKVLISHLLKEAGGRPCLAHDEENIVLNNLESSLRTLNPTLQNIFIDLVTCGPPFRFSYMGFHGTCKWLSMTHDGLTITDMRYKLFELQYHGLLEITEGKIHIHDLFKDVAGRMRCDAGRSAGDACFFEHSLSKLSEDKCKQVKYIVSEGYGSEKDTWRAFTQCSQLEILEVRDPWRDEYSSLDQPFPLKALQLSEQNMQSLRYLYLQSCRSLERIKGWEGTPNLVSLKLFQCHSLRELGDVGCLQKLEELMMSGSRFVPDLTQCSSHLKKFRFSSCNSLTELESKLGLPVNLEELDLSDNSRLVDVSTISMLTALQRLNLSKCTALVQIPTLNASNLLSLDCSHCESLRELGSAICALTALEDLVLWGCPKLQTIRTMPNLVRLKVLKLDGCCSVRAQGKPPPLASRPSTRRALELALGGPSADLHPADESDTMFGDVGNAIASPSLMLQGSSDGSGAVHLENLRELCIEGTNWGGDHISSLDVNGLINLEVLELISFESLREIQGLSTLIKLRQLVIDRCSSIEEVGGSGALNIMDDDDGHVSLENGCATSQEVAIPGVMDAPSRTSSLPTLVQLPPNIEGLRLWACRSLRELRNLTHLSKLQWIDVLGCTSLRSAGLQVDASIERYDMRSCSSLTDVSSLASALPNLKFLSFTNCRLLREIPNLTHCTSLRWIDLGRCSSLLRAPQVDASIELYFMSSCSSLTDVSSLASALPNLTVLFLGDCSLLREIPNLTHCTSLQRIDLKGCSSLLRAPQVDESIERYDMSSCSSLTDVSSLASALPNLKKLFLRDCSLLREIPNLTHCTNLQSIDLEGCSSLLRAPQVPPGTKVSLAGTKVHKGQTTSISCSPFQGLRKLKHSKVHKGQTTSTSCSPFKGLRKLKHSKKAK